MQAILWDEPEHRDGDDGSRVIYEPMSESNVLPLLLDKAGYECGEDGDDKADAHASEEGNATVEASEPTGDGDEDTIV